jgi:ribonucleotide reductase beta subunit family protein with ferritin-like domain
MQTALLNNKQEDVQMYENEKDFKIDVEPILQENSNRFVLFPIKYHDIWEMYKKQVASFWTTEEIDLYQDINDWEKLNDNERHFIKYVLAFFAAR